MCVQPGLSQACSASSRVLSRLVRANSSQLIADAIHPEPALHPLGLCHQHQPLHSIPFTRPVSGGTGFSRLDKVPISTSRHPSAIWPPSRETLAAIFAAHARDRIASSHPALPSPCRSGLAMAMYRDARRPTSACLFWSSLRGSAYRQALAQRPRVCTSQA